MSRKVPRICFLLGLFATACCTVGIITVLPVALDGQQTGMWCWAASGQMTMNYIHPASNVQQCDEANKRFGRTDCCGNPVPSGCVNGGWPEYGKYNFKADVTSNTGLTWAQLTDQIFCQKKPFAFSWHWNGGGGHMMVATGYQTLNGVNYVWVNNPWPPSSTSSSGGVTEIDTYDTYVGALSQGHTHWDDYYNISYQ